MVHEKMATYIWADKPLLLLKMWHITSHQCYVSLLCCSVNISNSSCVKGFTVSVWLLFLPIIHLQLLTFTLAVGQVIPGARLQKTSLNEVGKSEDDVCTQSWVYILRDKLSDTSSVLGITAVVTKQLRLIWKKRIQKQSLFLFNTFNCTITLLYKTNNTHITTISEWMNEWMNEWNRKWTNE